MKCKICHSDAKPLFATKVLNKYDVQYYRCPNCEFIQTEKPYWLKEAYHHAITDLDIGLIYRNLEYSKTIYKTIVGSFDSQKQFLDFAGGYGIFVRMMRDMGLNFFHQDKYCENIFATNHSIEKAKESKFEALTALEVFEHLDNPLEEINKMLFLSDTIIFSTEIITANTPTKPKDWWYFIPETGQHIAFYSEKTLLEIARHFKSNYFRNGNLHMLTKVSFKNSPFTLNTETKILPSLLQPDYELAKMLLNKQSLSSTANPITQQKNTFADTLIKLSNQVKQNKKNIFLLNNKNKTLERNIQNIQYQYAKTDIERNDFENRLRKIYESKGWRFLRKMYIIRDFLFPKNSFIKKFIKNNIFKIKDLKIRFSNIYHRLNTKKNINLSSKEIVYIGHSYHSKTKSTGFLIDYLKENFEVTEILDESWQGQPFPDLTFVNDGYLAVIFFQNLPSPEVIKNINNNNIIFFPMYDKSGNNNYEYWKNYIDLKIINFSKTLHQKLVNWGFNSIYIQYFPKPLPFIKNKTHKVFFWQRTSAIDINLVEKLINNFKTKIHVHQAIDPNFSFSKPTKKQEKKFNITYSNWFKTREEMQQKIQECDIYIAPRETEGIGMSFLEAMSMGKTVVAINNPTMSEYIVNNKTGYLFDKYNPKSIDFSNISKVRKSTHDYIENGCKNWIKRKNKIIEFIKK